MSDDKDEAQKTEHSNKSWIKRLSGYTATFITSMFAWDYIARVFKEDHSAYDTLEGKNIKEKIVDTVKKEYGRAGDIKLWRSKVASMVTAVSGFVLTEYFVNKIEQNKNLKEQNKSLKSELQTIKSNEEKPTLVSAEIASDTTWQDKAKKTQDSKHSISV